MSKGLEMLEILKQRNGNLKINHKIGSRDIANQEIKEITQCFDNYVIPVIEKDLELLEQLEDIEEELGIDLVTLFKALQNGVWYKDYKDNDKIKFTDDIEEHMNCKELIVPAKYTIIGLNFRDYGKTFALTREELEDE